MIHLGIFPMRKFLNVELTLIKVIVFDEFLRNIFGRNVPSPITSTFYDCSTTPP